MVFHETQKEANDFGESPDFCSIRLKLPFAFGEIEGSHWRPHGLRSAMALITGGRTPRFGGPEERCWLRFKGRSKAVFDFQI